MTHHKNKVIPTPSLDEILKKNPPKEEVEDIEYEDEDEEEEMDTMFPLADFEKPFYDDEGNWIGDKEEDDEE